MAEPEKKRPGRRPGAHFECDFLDDPRVYVLNPVQWTVYSKLWIMSVGARHDVLCRSRWSILYISSRSKVSRNSVPKALDILHKVGLLEVTDHYINVLGVRKIHERMDWKEPYGCCAKAGAACTNLSTVQPPIPEPVPVPVPVPDPPTPPRGDRNPLVSPDRFLKAWNAAAGRQGWQAIRAMSSGRQKYLRARCGDQDWRSTWEEALAKAEESEFLRGKNDRGWRATADWFLRPDTVVKIMEGTYGDRTGRSAGGSNFDDIDYTDIPGDLK